MGFLGAQARADAHPRGIAHQGIVFAQAYAQAPTTVVSNATILTGTYPQTHRASEFGVPLADSSLRTCRICFMPTDTEPLRL